MSRVIKKRKWRPAIVGPCGPKGRRVFVLSWDKQWTAWKCKERGGDVCIWEREGEDKRAFVERCASFVGSYPLAQLIVKTKANRVAFERTYGADPRRTKG